MADKWYAILTPAGDLDSPHWLAIERVDPGGPGAVIMGLRVRQMAVRSGANGLLALPDGAPMTLEQVTLALGYTPQRVRHDLTLLRSYGLVRTDEDGGIWSTDPIVLEHFAREAAQQKRLSAPPERGPGRPPKPGALSNAERQKKYKDKKNNEKVTEGNEKVTESNENSAIISVTNAEQQTDIVDENPGNGNSQIKEVKVIKKQQQQQAKPDSPVVVYDQPLTQNIEAAEALLTEMPKQARSATLLSLLAQCLDKGATERDLRAKINKAKAKNALRPGGYLWTDLTAYFNGTDFDAADKDAAKDKAERQEQSEAAKRADAERVEAAAAAERLQLLDLQRAFLRLPEVEREQLEASARKKLMDIGRDNPDPQSLTSMAMDIRSGVIPV